MSQSIITGLGWAANDEYLVYSSGVIATAQDSTRSPYTKTSDGWAICVRTYNCDAGAYGGDWCDCVLISPTQSAVQFTVPDAFAYYNTFTYLGKTWYAGISGQNHIFGGATELVGAYPEIDFGGVAIVNDRNHSPQITEAAFLTIMQAAGVRIVQGMAMDYDSFLMGVLTGLELGRAPLPWGPAPAGAYFITEDGDFRFITEDGKPFVTEDTTNA